MLSPFEGAVKAESGEPVDIVSVEGGLVKGVGTDVDGVQLFKGIPFAGSTAGENRWKEPQPVEPWEGVKLADTWGDQSMQDVTINPVGTFWGDEFYFDDSFSPDASENGLNLNVYTPANTVNDNLPVLVWIHGGGNDHGHASEMEFYASKLAEKEVIVVEVQYRLSMFGFLALSELSEESEHGVSGNYAILDLVKSLKWVNQHIDGFGGNPEEVTIAGQSAGARNVTQLLRTPLAEGLFNKAIIQSGTQGFMPIGFPSLAEKEAADKEMITEAFGKEMTLEELRALPAEYFMNTKTADGSETLFNALNTRGTVLDGYVFTEESIDLMKDGALDGVDIMIGGTSDERTSLVSGPSTMSLEDFDQTMGETYGKSYVKSYKPSDPVEAYDLFLRSQSDMRFQRYMVSTLYAKVHNEDTNIYNYYFNHAPPGRNSEFYGSYHSSDLWYFFNSMRDVEGQREWTPADYTMGDIMSSYYANFVKNGNPNGESLPKWDEVDSSPKGSFIRFFDGKAESVTETPYPLRDNLNRKLILDDEGISPADLKNNQNNSSGSFSPARFQK